MAAPSERTFFPLPVSTGGGRSISAPFQFVTTGEDHLRVTVVNSQTACRVAIQGRRFDETGAIVPIAYALSPTADRVATTQIYPLGVGAIVNLAVWAIAGSPRIGQTFVIVQLVRGREGGTELLGTLLQGYVTSTQTLGWPGSPIVSSIEGPGYVRVIQATTPAPGNNVLEEVPTGARWELLSFSANFVTDATVISRIPMLYGDAGFGALFYGLTGLTVAASEVYTITWSSGYGAGPNANGIYVSCPIPHSLPILAGGAIATAVLGIQAGDQWVAPQLCVREWLEVP